jgi:hypothetical protein
MRNIVILGLLSVTSFAIELGLQMSGYENIYLAYGLKIFGGLLAVVALCLWLIPKLKNRGKNRYEEIHEIEVPEELREKVFGKPKVEGKLLDIKTRVVKRKAKK